MILFSLLLSAGLDLFLPEFQPDDVSGNYIVSSFDVSENEYVVTEVSSNDVLLSNVESSALGADSTQQVSSNDDLISSIDSFHDDNNRYWELFLDSYTVEVSHVSYSSEISPSVFYINGSGQIKSDSALSNYHVFYVPVSAGAVYTISDLSPLPYSNNYYRCGVVDSISNPTVLTNFFSKGYDEISPFTIIPNQDGFLCFSSWNFNNSVSFVSNWVTYEQDSYTLSELGNAVIETKQGLRWLYLLVFFNIVLGLTYKVLDLFGGNKHA